MKTTITFEIDPDNLQSYTDDYLAAYWHVSQANPASFGDKAACLLAESIKTEIVRRWLSLNPPMLYSHQACHVWLNDKLKNGSADAQSAATSAQG